MASKDIKQSHMVLLYQSMILSVIDYGPGLTTLSQSNLLELDRVQNEAMGVILGKTTYTIQHVCSLAEFKQVRDWEKRSKEFKPYYVTQRT